MPQEPRLDPVAVYAENELLFERYWRLLDVLYPIGPAGKPTSPEIDSDNRRHSLSIIALFRDSDYGPGGVVGQLERECTRMEAIVAERSSREAGPSFDLDLAISHPSNA